MHKIVKQYSHGNVHVYVIENIWSCVAWKNLLTKWFHKSELIRCSVIAYTHLYVTPKTINWTPDSWNLKSLRPLKSVGKTQPLVYFLSLLTTRFSLKSMPTVEINFPVNTLSVYWKSIDVFPTPESPGNSNLCICTFIARRVTRENQLSVAFSLNYDAVNH